jgi:hypothetical protein
LLWGCPSAEPGPVAEKVMPTLMSDHAGDVMPPNSSASTQSLAEPTFIAVLPEQSAIVVFAEIMLFSLSIERSHGFLSVNSPKAVSTGGAMT